MQNATDKDVQADILTSHYPGLEIADHGHIGALKELAVCYDVGKGPFWFLFTSKDT
jgi:hypothetical protein